MLKDLFPKSIATSPASAVSAPPVPAEPYVPPDSTRVPIIGDIVWYWIVRGAYGRMKAALIPRPAIVIWIDNINSNVLLNVFGNGNARPIQEIWSLPVGVNREVKAVPSSSAEWEGRWSWPDPTWTMDKAVIIEPPREPAGITYTTTR